MAASSTAQEILDLAQSMCQKRGFNAFSYKDIAEKLQIKTASIHYHFPTKAKLGEALIERYRNEFGGRLQEISARCEDPADRLHEFGKILEEMKDQRKVCLCCMLAADLETLEIGMQKQVRDFFAAGEGWVADCLAAGKKSGVFSFSKSPKTVAKVFMAAVQGMLLRARAFGGDEGFGEGADWLFSIIEKQR